MRLSIVSMLVLALAAAVGTALGTGCASSSRKLNTQQERQLKVGLVKEHAREMTPVQRTAFLHTRFGTEQLARERLMKMIEANRVHGRSVARDRATLMELHKIQAGPRVGRVGPGSGTTPPAGESP